MSAAFARAAAAAEHEHAHAAGCGDGEGVMASPVPPPRLPPDSATRPLSSAPFREHIDAEVRAVDTTDTGGDPPHRQLRNPDLRAHFFDMPPTIDRLRRPEADASCPPASARQQPFADSTTAALKERARARFSPQVRRTARESDFRAFVRYLAQLPLQHGSLTQ